MEKLWGKRFTALLIDIIAVTLVTWIISALIYPLIAMAGIFSILNYWLILTIILIMGYFTYLEGKYSTTLGKQVIKLKVITDEGKMDYKKACLRNISKILWIPLILDVIVASAAKISKIRYLDKIASTNVVSNEIIDKGERKSSDKSEITS